MPVLQIPPGFADLASGSLPDADLLARFVEAGDDGAFAVLVRRYAPAVRAACRVHRLAEADADDVFQTTFLELVRKAERIRVRAALGGWVYRVAERAANRLRRRRPAAPLPDELPGEPRVAFDDADVVMEEVARLPEKYRKAVAFCYLGGKTTADAAAELGWAKGTVLTRLAWARKRLHDRLTRRGVALSFLAISAVSARTVAATVSAARRRLDAPPPGLFPFFNNWKEAMFIPKLIAAVGVLVAVAAGVWTNGHAGAEPPKAKAELPKAKPAEPKWVGTWVRHDEIRDDLGILWDTRTCIAIGETAFTYTVDWVHKRGKLQCRFDGEYLTGTDGRVFGFLAKAGSSPDQVENSKYDRFLKQLVGVPFTLAAAVEGKTLTLDSPRGLPSFGDHKIDPANTRSLLVGKYTRVDPKEAAAAADAGRTGDRRRGATGAAEAEGG